MEDLKNTVKETTQKETTQQEKLFTQEDVNRIVGERLARERKGIENEPNPKELELQQREAKLYIREVAQENDLPQDVVGNLEGLDKKTIDIIVKIIAPYIQKSKEPILNPTIRTQGAKGIDDSIRTAMGLKG